MVKDSIRGKRRARKFALQALYQWHMSGTDPQEIEVQFRIANDFGKVDVDYFCDILHNIPKKQSLIDETFLPFLDREIQSLNPVELAVLRLGTYEFLFHPEVPYKVVLDEAISLTRTYGSQDGYKYVNGVLNQVAKQIRKVEISLDT